MKHKIFALLIAVVLIFSAIAQTAFTSFADDKNELTSTFEVYLGEEFTGRKVTLYENSEYMTTLIVGESGKIAIQEIKEGAEISLKLEPVEEEPETNEVMPQEKETSDNSSLLFYLGLVVVGFALVPMIVKNHPELKNIFKKKKDSESPKE